MRGPWRLLIHGLLFMLITSVLSIVLSAPLGLVEDPDAQFRIDDNGAFMSAGMLLAGTLSALVGALVSTWFAAIYLDRRALLDLGLRLNSAWWTDFGFGMALGIILVGGGFAVKLAMGWVEIVGTGVAEAGIEAVISEFIVLAVAFLAIGIYEELVVRGYQMTNLAEALNIPSWGRRGAVVVALLLTSVLFSVLHAFNPGHTILGLGNIALISLLVLGLGYALTGRLGFSIGLHTTWNFALGFVFGIPVSGVSVARAPILLTNEIGPELWTGGAFGHEGGLLGTLAILGGLVALLVWVRLREGRIVIVTDLADPPTKKRDPAAPQ